MFERFARSARTVVNEATRLARDAHEPEVREEHVALAVLANVETPGRHALAATGCTSEDLAALTEELTRVSHRAGVTASDADALRELGIDVDEALARLDEISRRRARHRHGRSRRVRWSSGAKQVLDRALREALDFRDHAIDDAHLLLALLHVRGGVAEVMEAHGVTYGGVRRAIAVRQAG